MKDRVKTFPENLENEWNFKEKNRENKQREYKGLVWDSYGNVCKNESTKVSVKCYSLKDKRENVCVRSVPDVVDDSNQQLLHT